MKIHGLTHLSAPILDRSDVFGNCFYVLLQGNVFIYVNFQRFALFGLIYSNAVNVNVDCIILFGANL